MNKYRSASRALARERKRWNTCTNKKAYTTVEAARQKGNDHYRCPYCKLWHRTGAAAALAAKVRGKR